jgi:hypothetical protein
MRWDTFCLRQGLLHRTGKSFQKWDRVLDGRLDVAGDWHGVEQISPVARTD